VNANRSCIALAALIGASSVSLSLAHAETLRVGVTPGPHAEIMEVVAEVAAGEGLTLEILEFSDYVVPNTALADGDLDLNSFQHQPYLDNQIRDRGFDLVNVAPTVIFPMGFYSERHASMDDVPDGATFAIQNDPTNGGRSLLLLQSAGLLTLADGTGLTPSILDISENPHDYQFIELDAAQLPRSLSDVDVGAVNTNYAVEAGLDPNEDAILMEGQESPYMNIIAVRAEDANAEWVERFVNAYHSDPVRDFVEERFQGAVIAGF
jgi:D-methionine transport system substrate-binding protein